MVFRITRRMRSLFQKTWARWPLRFQRRTTEVRSWGDVCLPDPSQSLFDLFVWSQRIFNTSKFQAIWCLLIFGDSTHQSVEIHDSSDKVVWRFKQPPIFLGFFTIFTNAGVRWYNTQWERTPHFKYKTNIKSKQGQVGSLVGCSIVYSVLSPFGIMTIFWSPLDMFGGMGGSTKNYQSQVQFWAFDELWMHLRCKGSLQMLCGAADGTGVFVSPSM